ncbi:hypothetical protein LTR97_011173 [Elasticomyces elasticus]|uniref:Uncharacterized protein n=1 Tax=Elasticomyces elasticus TaxID=574655 RepID=A0AAN7VT16_9PEZI|nr:hypothetical protein LTR97_011173 [Elasticomyces elasticus]
MTLMHDSLSCIEQLRRKLAIEVHRRNAWEQKLSDIGDQSGGAEQPLLQLLLTEIDNELASNSVQAALSNLIERKRLWHLVMIKPTILFVFRKDGVQIHRLHQQLFALSGVGPKSAYLVLKGSATERLLELAQTLNRLNNTMDLVSHSESTNDLIYHRARFRNHWDRKDVNMLAKPVEAPTMSMAMFSKQRSGLLTKEHGDMIVQLERQSTATRLRRMREGGTTALRQKYDLGHEPPYPELRQDRGGAPVTPDRALQPSLPERSLLSVQAVPPSVPSPLLYAGAAVAGTGGIVAGSSAVNAYAALKTSKLAAKKDAREAEEQGMKRGENERKQNEEERRKQEEERKCLLHDAEQRRQEAEWQAEQDRKRLEAVRVQRSHEAEEERKKERHDREIQKWDMDLREKAIMLEREKRLAQIVQPARDAGPSALSGDPAVATPTVHAPGPEAVSAAAPAELLPLETAEQIADDTRTTLSDTSDFAGSAHGSNGTSSRSRSTKAREQVVNHAGTQFPATLTIEDRLLDDDDDELVRRFKQHDTIQQSPDLVQDLGTNGQCGNTVQRSDSSDPQALLSIPERSDCSNGTDVGHEQSDRLRLLTTTLGIEVWGVATTDLGALDPDSSEDCIAQETRLGETGIDSILMTTYSKDNPLESRMTTGTALGRESSEPWSPETWASDKALWKTALQSGGRRGARGGRTHNAGKEMDRKVLAMDRSSTDEWAPVKLDTQDLAISRWVETRGRRKQRSKKRASKRSHSSSIAQEGAETYVDAADGVVLSFYEQAVARLKHFGRDHGPAYEKAQVDEEGLVLENVA